jgi:hypothetical protein
MSMDRLLTSKQSLVEALQMKSVALVLGPDAVQVELDPPSAGAPPRVASFYDLVGDELLRTYNTALPEPQTGSGSSWHLHRVAAQILADNDDVSPERLRRSASSLVKAVAGRVKASPLLARLAALKAFDLYICLTPDDCLVDALRQVHGADHLEVSAYAPNADSSQPVDISPARDGLVRVFFPLGRSATGSRLAIHEEDALEFLYKFQEEGVRRAPVLIGELRRRDLLLLGCNLPDWLGRGFLRLANESRLSSQDKKMEFFAADAKDAGLNAFLSRFNPNASVFPWAPAEFIGELEAMVTPRARAAEPAATPAVARPPAGGHGGPTIFVSYASEDADAARRLAQSLSALGFADVWLDKRKLIAGDDWSDHIDDAIEHCDFFMPVLSRQADQRREGVFWEEWRKALMRAMRVNDAFLLPVGIDVAQPDRAGYERIFSGFTSEFRRLHLLHAPEGTLSDAASTELRARCGRFGEATRV